MRKLVSVPQTDLDMLEEARQELYEIAALRGWDMVSLTRITQTMWRLANRKYSEVETMRKVGERVKVVGNESNHHFNIGDIVEVKSVKREGQELFGLGETGKLESAWTTDGFNYWYIDETEVESIV